MKKKEIVKLVFALIFLLAAIWACVPAVSLRHELSQISEQSSESGEQTSESGENTATTKEQVGKAIGGIFAALFGAIAAIRMAIIAAVGDLISLVICIFGIKAPEKPSKIVFWILFALNVVNAVIAIVGTFVGF